MRLKIEHIPVKKDFLDPSKFERAIENFLDAGAENVRIDLLTTTQTWKRKPAFTIEKTSDSERWICTDNLIYKFVSGGTRVRYATMTKNFRPKTRVGRIGSSAGRGGVAFISRNHPRPGIQAREFPKAIVKKWRLKWITLFERMQQTALG